MGGAHNPAIWRPPPIPEHVEVEILGTGIRRSGIHGDIGCFRTWAGIFQSVCTSGIERVGLHGLLSDMNRHPPGPMPSGGARGGCVRAGGWIRSGPCALFSRTLFSLPHAFQPSARFSASRTRCPSSGKISFFIASSTAPRDPGVAITMV